MAFLCTPVTTICPGISLGLCLCYCRGTITIVTKIITIRYLREIWTPLSMHFMISIALSIFIYIIVLKTHSYNSMFTLIFSALKCYSISNSDKRLSYQMVDCDHFLNRNSLQILATLRSILLFLTGNKNSFLTYKTPGGFTSAGVLTFYLSVMLRHFAISSRALLSPRQIQRTVSPASVVM